MFYNNLYCIENYFNLKICTLIACMTSGNVAGGIMQCFLCVPIVYNGLWSYRKDQVSLLPGILPFGRYLIKHFSACVKQILCRNITTCSVFYVNIDKRKKGKRKAQQMLLVIKHMLQSVKKVNIRLTEYDYFRSRYDMMNLWLSTLGEAYIF